MKISCLSKTIINEYNKVRLLIITNENIYSGDELLSTYRSNDHFKIVGLPMKAELLSHGYFKVEEDLASELTLNIIKEHVENYEEVELEFNKNFKRDNDTTIWDVIQNKIFNAKLISKGYKIKGFYQLAIIDEEVYQMCLKEEKISYLGKNFLESSSNFLSRIEKIKFNVEIKTKERIQKLSDSLKLKNSSYSDKELNKIIAMPIINSKIFDLEGIFSTSFSSNILAESIYNNLESYLFENYYVLSVLDNNGYYLVPFKVLGDEINQLCFTKMLLKDQIKEFEKGDDELSSDVAEIKYEYSIELKKLKESFTEWQGQEFANNLLECISINDIIKIEEETEISEMLSDYLPSYIKQIKVI